VSELEERVRAIESQLNEVENRYSDSETTLQGVFRLLARTENKRHEIQGQLEEGLLQVGTLQAELARATSELNDERRRNTLLESDLNLARRQAGAAETLRFQNERLQQENQRLGNDASAQRLEIADLQSHIRELKEQAGADAEKVECLDQALRNEKATTTELLSKVSKLKRDSSQAGNELRQLRDRYAKLEEKEADLDRSKCSLENDRDALQQSNDRLQREMTRLQEIIDQTSRRKSQLPRRIGWVRSRGSMPKL
jgi:chromosome segregation ATPase